MNKCEKCGAENLRQSGPYARRKPEGEPARKGTDEISFLCLNCGNEWKEDTK
jgi:DNA-directed RNA polymerase subunit RPC12/RpoP